jgi:hypothetical protein
MIRSARIVTPGLPHHVSHGEDWPWSSVRAHLATAGDELMTVRPCARPDALLRGVTVGRSAGGIPRPQASRGERPPGRRRAIRNWA